MVKKKLIFFFLFLILITFFCPYCTAKTTQNDFLIIGGKRIGPVMLGQPLKKYQKFLGQSKKIKHTFFNYPKKGLAVLTENGIIVGIMTYSPKYGTKQGIRVGSTVSDLRKKYGNYLKTDAGSLTYSELGLACVEKDGKITKIMVVKAEPDPLLEDSKIIPGSRAGGIKIGMNIDLVKKYWGKPDTVTPTPKTVSPLLYVYRKKAVSLKVSDNIIKEIIIESYKYMTEEGIDINSTRTQVIKLSLIHI